MDYKKMSFKERAALGMIQLLKQPPVTVEQARKQAQWLKENSKTNIRKQRITNEKSQATN